MKMTPGTVMTALRTLTPSKFLACFQHMTRSSVNDRSWNCLERVSDAANVIYRRSVATSATNQFHTKAELGARNHSEKREKFSFDPESGSDSDVKDKVMRTVNESVVFEHFNQKGRRLPRVYVWGCSETGALGHAAFVHPRKPKPRGDYAQRAQRAKKLKTPDPIPVVASPYRCTQPDYFNLNISHVAAGHGFSIWVNSNNKAKLPRVVGTGLNYESQLGGVRFTDKTTGEERIIDVLLEPSDIKIPLLNKSSRVTQGIGAYFRDPNRRGSKTMMTDNLISQSGTLSIGLSVTLVLDIEMTKKVEHFSDVSCGRAHSVFLTDEGVFTMGSNAQGQCGRKIIDNEVYRGNSVIHKIESIPNPVVQVVCGLDHTLFLTSTGAVYSCGWGADGQTGLGHYNKTDVPTRISGDIEGVKIRQLTCKADCVLAVSEDGDLFGWGNSEYNQLSIVTPSTQVRLPRHLPFSVGRVKKAAAGASACAVLTEAGEVCVWGYGILGLGPNVENLAEPQALPPPLFGISHLNPNLSVVDIQAGMSHFAAIVESPKRILDNRTRKEIPPFRELYTWGANRRGCLGLGREDNQPFPFKVVLDASVNQVSCGTNHTIALCDPLLL